MPLDSTAERVPEPPQEEASEATLKKQPEGRPELRVVAPPEEATLEVSPAAQETFSDQTKETVAGLQPESKGFVGKLYEKIKSSEVVQNVVDRYQVWRNESLATRAQSKVDKLGEAQKGAQEEAARFDASATKVREMSLKSQAILREMEVEVSPEVKNQLKAEYDAHLARAEEGRDKAQDIEGRIQDVKGVKEDYDVRVNEARGRLDGRLAAKQEINNQLLQEYNSDRDSCNAGIEADQEYFKELDGNAEKLRVLLKEDLPKQLRPTIEKNLKDIEGRQAGLLVGIKTTEAARAKVESRIKDLERKTADLQAKRDKIFPPKEKPAEAEKPAEKPIGRYTRDNGITLEFGGGKNTVLENGKIFTISPDGSHSDSLDVEDAADDLLEQFIKGSRAATIRGGVSEKVVARIEEAMKSKPETEKQPKFLASDIVAAWNQEVGKNSGLTVSLEKSADPKKDLGSETSAKEMLLTLLAKKINKGNVKGLSGRAKGKVENFLAQRSAARR